MSARYVVRLDDAVPTRNRARWTEVEALLDELDVRPIVAVVPDNRDPALHFDAHDPAFWDVIRSWQAKQWRMALHGLHHAYHPVDKSTLVLPFKAASEYAGLDREAQEGLLRDGMSIFARERVIADIFVAPGHAFDRTTLAALVSATSIRRISDGLAFDAFVEDGLTWLPQQLWRPSWRPFGLWTICLHPNTMSSADVAKVARGLRRLRGRFVDPLAVEAKAGGSTQKRLFPIWFAVEQAVLKGVGLVGAWRARHG